MKKLVLLSLSFLSLNAFGQNTLLFEISGNGLETPSYLFGTMHVQDEAAFGWNDSVFWAIRKAEVSAFELDFNSKNLKNKIKPSKSQMKDWEEFLVDDLRPAIEQTVSADTLGARIALFYGDILKMVLEKDKNKRATFVDMFLKEYDEKNKKEVVGIESVQEQLDVFMETDKSLLKKGIIDFLEEDNWDVDISMMMGSQKDLVDVYSKKKLTDVCAMMNEQMTSSNNKLVNDMYTRLFEERNEIMVKRVSKMIKKQSHFVAVGAGHLCNKTGLVKQLEKAGYTIRPMDIMSNSESTKSIDWVSYTNDRYTVQVPQGVSDIDPMDNTSDAYGSYSTVNAALFTPKGKAQFRIEKVVESNYSDDGYGYLEEAEASEDYTYEVEDAAAVEEDYTYDEEVAEAEEVVDETESVYSTDDAYEGEESVEEEVAMETYDYDTQPDVDYEEEAESDYDYGAEAKKKKRKSVKEGFENEYWNTVGKAVMSRAMGQLMAEAMAKSSQEGSEDDYESDTSQEIMVMGETHKVVTSSFLDEYSKSMQITTDDGIYELSITGDTRLLDSGELDAFFTSFQLK